MVLSRIRRRFRYTRNRTSDYGEMNPKITRPCILLTSVREGKTVFGSLDATSSSLLIRSSDEFLWHFGLFRGEGFFIKHVLNRSSKSTRLSCTSILYILLYAERKCNGVSILSREILEISGNFFLFKNKYSHFATPISSPCVFLVFFAYHYFYHVTRTIMCAERESIGLIAFIIAFFQF